MSGNCLILLKLKHGRGSRDKVPQKWKLLANEVVIEAILVHILGELKSWEGRGNFPPDMPDKTLSDTDGCTNYKFLG